MPLGRLGLDNVTIAGLSIVNQTVGVVEDTNDTTTYGNGAVGVFGLGFPLSRSAS